MGILRLQGWACALTAIQTSTPILSSCHLVMHGLVGTRNQKEVGRGECPWPCNVGCWGRVPPVAGARGLISKAYRTSRSWPTSRRCTQGAKPATQCCTRILPAWFRPQLLRPLQLSTTIDRRPSTVDHHGDPLPPSLFFCSAGTLPPPRERERESSSSPAAPAICSHQGPRSIVQSRVKRVSTSFWWIFPVHCQPTSERKPQTTRAAQYLATSAHNPSQLRLVSVRQEQPPYHVWTISLSPRPLAHPSPANLLSDTPSSTTTSASSRPRKYHNTSRTSR